MARVIHWIGVQGILEKVVYAIVVIVAGHGGFGAEANAPSPQFGSLSYRAR